MSLAQGNKHTDPAEGRDLLLFTNNIKHCRKIHLKLNFHEGIVK